MKEDKEEQMGEIHLLIDPPHRDLPAGGEIHLLVDLFHWDTRNQAVEMLNCSWLILVQVVPHANW